MRFLSIVWRQLKEFVGLGGTASYLWPRWLVLRGVGIVYVVIFGGIIREGRALVGPNGLAPIAHFCATLRNIFPHAVERFIRAPSFFWISTDAFWLGALPWAGLLAALALVLNWWPRMALFVCWAVLLSFVSTWQLFSPSIDDGLMLETALLCLVYAPAGFFPGLGAASPPRPMAVFTMRWLLFRIMFGSGLIKVFAGDSAWRDLTAMQVMHETAPSPTILGYFDYHLPHAYQIFEIALTLTAELVAPLLAVFGGRRGRWIAFFIWTLFQAGIQLTGNYGWLNTAAIALGFLLLDDQMLAAAAQKLRLDQLATRFAAAAPATFTVPRWGQRAVAALLWLHFGLTFYFFAAQSTGKLELDVPKFAAHPVEYLFRDFHSINAYTPYAGFPAVRYEVEFVGSNDNGATWRPYEFRHKPQREDRMCRFIAPWFARFETSLQLALYSNSPIISRVAQQLLARNPDVTGLFDRDPFPDQPPRIIRMMVYQFSFTDLPAYHATGHYWKKTYVGDFVQAVRNDPSPRQN